MGAKTGFLDKLIGFLIAMDVNVGRYPLQRAGSSGCSNFVIGLNDFMANLILALLDGLQRGTRIREDYFAVGSVDIFT